MENMHTRPIIRGVPGHCESATHHSTDISTLVGCRATRRPVSSRTQQDPACICCKLEWESSRTSEMRWVRGLEVRDGAR